MRVLLLLRKLAEFLRTSWIPVSIFTYLYHKNYVLIFIASLENFEILCKVPKHLFTGNLGIIDKGGLNNLQTKADKEAQVLIVSSLVHHFPGVRLLVIVLYIINQVIT